MSLSLIIDIVVAVLLVVTIGYAVVLNKRLGNLRRDRGELEKLAINFHASTQRADESVGRLKSSVASLQGQIEKAESIRDDLVFLTERGSSTADRIEDAVRMSRGDLQAEPAQRTNAAPRPVKKPAAKTDIAEVPAKEGLTANLKDRIDNGAVSEAEKELLKALRSAS